MLRQTGTDICISLFVRLLSTDEQVEAYWRPSLLCQVQDAVRPARFHARGLACCTQVGSVRIEAEDAAIVVPPLATIAVWLSVEFGNDPRRQPFGSAQSCPYAVLAGRTLGSRRDQVLGSLRAG